MNKLQKQNVAFLLGGLGIGIFCIITKTIPTDIALLLTLVIYGVSNLVSLEKVVEKETVKNFLLRHNLFEKFLKELKGDYSNSEEKK